MSYQPPQGPQGPPQPPQWPPGPPQQPQWGQPGYEPPPSKPKPPIYRRPWFVILGAIGVLVVVGALLGDPPAEAPTTAQREPAETQAPAQETPEPAETTPEAAGTGTPVRDGKFEFTVQRVECGKSRVGSRISGRRRKGISVSCT